MTALEQPLPTPADIPAGHVVRYRIGGHVYTSPVMSPTRARTEANTLTGHCDAAWRDTSAPQWVDLAVVDGRTVRVRLRSVNAVEYGTPPARTDTPAVPR